VRPGATQDTLVRVGRWSTVVFLAFGCAVALSPLPRGGVFAFIQEFQGYISPGILAAFLVGFVVPKAPPMAGVTAVALSAPIYGVLQWQMGDVAYLHRMLLTFVVLVAVMLAMALARPLAEPRCLPVQTAIDTTPSRPALAAGAAVIAAVIVFFVMFW
jgi:SSS family solute:Na+ symporter